MFTARVQGCRGKQYSACRASRGTGRAGVQNVKSAGGASAPAAIKAQSGMLGYPFAGGTSLALTRSEYVRIAASPRAAAVIKNPYRRR